MLLNSSHNIQKHVSKYWISMSSKTLRKTSNATLLVFLILLIIYVYVQHKQHKYRQYILKQTAYNNNHHLINITFQFNEMFTIRNLTVIRFHIGQIIKGIKPLLIHTFDKINIPLFKNLSLQYDNEVANAYKNSYFEILGKLNITTVFLKVGCEILSHLQFPLLIHSSNNCKRISSPNHYHSICVNKPDLINTTYFNISAFNVGLPQGYEFYLNKKATVTYIHVLPNAVVVEDGDIYINGLKIVPQRCQQNLRYQANIIKDTSYSKNKIFTIAQFWGAGYFHAMIENLPRISPYLEILRKHKDIKIHVKKKTAFIVTALNILGIDSCRIITGNWKADIIYMPAGTACGSPSIFNIQLLSMEMRLRIPYPPQERKSIIVIQRSTKRYFKHHKKIVELIKEYLKDSDVTVEIFSDQLLPTFNDTMAMFNRAFMVVAPHGAGESNLIFSEPGTVLIEGLCVKNKQEIVLCYRNLMSSLGHEYFGFLAKNNCLETKAEELLPVISYYMNKYLNTNN